MNIEKKISLSCIYDNQYAQCFGVSYNNVGNKITFCYVKEYTSILKDILEIDSCHELNSIDLICSSSTIFLIWLLIITQITINLQACIQTSKQFSHAQSKAQKLGFYLTHTYKTYRVSTSVALYVVFHIPYQYNICLGQHVVKWTRSQVGNVFPKKDIFMV